MTGRLDSREPSLSSSESIERWLVAALASLLEIEPQSIDPNERFKHYGLESSGALRLIADLGRRIGRSLPATLLWDRPTIASVAAHLASELAAAAPGSGGAGGGAGGGATGGGDGDGDGDDEGGG
jgi:acyl carrier protein